MINDGKYYRSTIDLRQPVLQIMPALDIHFELISQSTSPAAEIPTGNQTDPWMFSCLGRKSGKHGCCTRQKPSKCVASEQTNDLTSLADTINTSTTLSLSAKQNNFSLKHLSPLTSISATSHPSFNVISLSTSSSPTPQQPNFSLPSLLEPLLTSPSMDDNNSGSSSISNETHSPDISISPPDIAALLRLSENLESIFETPNSEFYNDGKIIVPNESREVPIHRCILSARSPYFKNLFANHVRKEKRLKLELKNLMKEFDVGFDSLVLVLRYLYSGKVKALPRNVCVCVDDDCEHLACKPAVVSMVEALYASFVFEIPELVALYQRRLLDVLDKVAVDDMLVILSVAKICFKSCERLLTECIDIVVKSDIDIITLEKSLPHDILKQIMDSRSDLGIIGDTEYNTVPNKHVKRIHRALDSDDVELVRWLLKEGHTTLDDALALHYAVAYCDPKTTTEVLDLGLADVNHRNSRGYTVLHVAAMRKEPKIILSLLTKGARPSDLTSDGKKALQISKRLTRALDYYRSTEEGKSSPKDRLCIEVLEQAEIIDPLLWDASASLAMAGEDMRMKLLYLENRVGLAKLLFPMEAQVAMDIAHVDDTHVFPFGMNSRRPPGGQVTPMDLNEAPFKIKEVHVNRIRALSRTVELGKRFFPRCSDVLNKIMDTEDLTELAFLENNTPEERQRKKRRYMELQDVLEKALKEDKEELDKSAALSSSSSSSTLALMRTSTMLHPLKK